MAENKGENLLIEDDEDQESKSKSQDVEFVPVDTQAADQDDNDDDEGEGGEDARLSEDNEDREELRRKRREEKAERAARRKEAIQRDKTELNFLRQRNEALEKRMSAVEKTAVANTISNIDSRLSDKIAEVRAAERIMGQAVEAGNGEDVAKALRIRDEAMKQVQQLQILKHRESQTAQEIHHQPPALDPEIASHAQEWVSRNQWYNPNGKSEESKIVLAIDQTLVEEGYNPKSEAYWKELDRRVSIRLPNLKGGSDNDEGSAKTGRRGPPVGSTRDHAPASSRQQVYISPERKQAMIDAGVWEDTVLRQRYLKQYAKWDRDNSNNATR